VDNTGYWQRHMGEEIKRDTAPAEKEVNQK